MLRQADNEAKIEGILSEVDIKEIELINKTNGQKYSALTGAIVIRVNQTINGKLKRLEIPVSLFGKKYKDNGEISPAYTSILAVKNDFKPISVFGEDEADAVRTSLATISMNEYYGKTELVSFPRIRTSFVNRVNRAELKEEAKFEVELYVGQSIAEVDKEGVETGNWIINGVVPQYGGKVDIVPFYGMNPSVIDIVSQRWSPESTVKAVGRINFSTDVIVTSETVGFGEPVEKTKTIRTSKLVITGGSEIPLDEEFSFSKEDINEGLTKRLSNLAAIKAKKEAKAEASKSSSSMGTFGAAAPSQGTPQDAGNFGF